MSLEKFITSTWADCMAVFWVQHFFTLPVILENFGMGDEIPQYRRQGPALRELDANEQQGWSTAMLLVSTSD